LLSRRGPSIFYDAKRDVTHRDLLRVLASEFLIDMV
jgi:hypothetical protein